MAQSVVSEYLVLAGIATVTQRIQLGSGVTVLSSDDPVHRPPSDSPAPQSIPLRRRVSRENPASCYFCGANNPHPVQW